MNLEIFTKLETLIVISTATGQPIESFNKLFKFCQNTNLTKLKTFKILNTGVVDEIKNILLLLSNDKIQNSVFGLDKLVENCQFNTNVELAVDTENLVQTFTGNIQVQFPKPNYTVDGKEYVLIKYGASCISGYKFALQYRTEYLDKE